ncbi:MAG: outer membrane beta-barrel protein [Gemmatimonadales bacterium]
MRRIAAALSLLVLVLAVAASPSSAQARGYVGAGGGVSVASGTFNDQSETGFTLHVVAGISGGARGLIGGRVNGSWARHSDKAGDGKTRFIGAMGDIVISPGTPGSGARLYFLGGAGFQGIKEEVLGVSATETKFAVNFGGGLLVRAASNLGLSFEARYLSVRTEGNSTNMIPVTLGLRFGGL